MRISPDNAFRAELLTPSGTAVAFDAPRCALEAWRTGKVGATSLRVREYYDGAPRDGSTLRFVVGGDVVGPMGPDLVPVDPARASKFIRDHHADRALTLDEITAETVRELNRPSGSL